MPASLSLHALHASNLCLLLIIAHMDEDFAIEFKRILKSRKSRKVGIDSYAEGRKLDEDPKFMPESRKYYRKTAGGRRI